jgi:uncharacterized protein YegJ (DUF2314 family)
VRRFALLLLIVLCVPSCYRPSNVEGELRARLNNPFYVLVGEHDPEWDDAAREAQYNLGLFIKALEYPTPQQSSFALKTILQEGNHSEAVWLTSLEFDGKTFYGKINNDPISLRKQFLGTRVAVDQSRVRDWMYVDNGRLQGGYSLKLMYRKLDPIQRKKMEDSLWFTMN